MYKFLGIDELTGQPHKVVFRLGDNTSIPLLQDNIDYQRFLDEINEQGVEIVEGELPEFVLQEAADRKFSKQLIAYKAAVERLAQYIVAEGCSEVKQMLPGGEKVLNEETGEQEDVLVETVTQNAVEPLPETVEVWEQDGDELMKKTVRNPAIVQDEEQRAAAQAIVDATPQEVKDAAK